MSNVDHPASFVLALCHEGAEGALKSEAQVQGLRPAYQSKGLVTLKHDGRLPAGFALSSALTRFWAESLGPSTPTDAVTQARSAGAVLHHHAVIPAANEEEDREEETSAAPVPSPGQTVLTLIDAGGRSWLTTHVHAGQRTPFPANCPPLRLPEDAPSRAWLKIEEAIARFSLRIGAGSRVLEIGSSPGGASWALLQRGAEVVGLDPNAMHRRVLSHPRFQHVREASIAITPAAIPGPFDWVLLDVNVPPGTALRGVFPFLATHQRTLKGAVLTLKLGRFDMVKELPSWLHRIGERLPGFTLVPTSFHSHGREIVVVCMRQGDAVVGGTAPHRWGG